MTLAEQYASELSNLYKSVYYNYTVESDPENVQCYIVPNSYDAISDIIESISLSGDGNFSMKENGVVLINQYKYTWDFESFSFNVNIGLSDDSSYTSNITFKTMYLPYSLLEISTFENTRTIFSNPLYINSNYYSLFDYGDIFSEDNDVTINSTTGEITINNPTYSVWANEGVRHLYNVTLQDDFRTVNTETSLRLYAVEKPTSCSLNYQNYIKNVVWNDFYRVELFCSPSHNMILFDYTIETNNLPNGMYSEAFHTYGRCSTTGTYVCDSTITIKPGQDYVSFEPLIFSSTDTIEIGPRCTIEYQNLTVKAGENISLFPSIQNENNITKITSSNLPSGLQINSQTGEITGATDIGTYNPTVTLYDKPRNGEQYNVSKTFTITVIDSNIDCTNCTNCYNCIRCVDCNYCINCIDCNNCRYCDSCNNCVNVI